MRWIHRHLTHEGFMADNLDEHLSPLYSIILTLCNVTEVRKSHQYSLRDDSCSTRIILNQLTPPQSGFDAVTLCHQGKGSACVFWAILLPEKSYIADLIKVVRRLAGFSSIQLPWRSVMHREKGSSFPTSFHWYKGHGKLNTHILIYYGDWILEGL